MSHEMQLVAPEAQLETPRLLLESLVPTHAFRLYEQLRNERLYRFIPQVPPYSLQALEDRYELLSSRRSSDGREAWLNWAVCERSFGCYAGTLENTVHVNPTATIAYTVFVPYQRLGFAREACGCLAAEIDTRNVASVALVEARKFSRIAFQKDADHFRGTSSDECRYELKGSVWSKERAGSGG